MKKTFTLIALFFLCNTLFINAQNNLMIHDPNMGWYGESGGVIDEASFLIEPKGAYMEVGMILTVSAPDNYFGNWNQLEIVLDFRLPEGSIVHDSWLWMEDDTTIVKADVLEYWEASTIYDDIVLIEQQDPSILFQTGPDEYRIRIYPLASDHYRKFKITYLVPAKWTLENVSALLPRDLFNTSIIPLDKVDVFTIPDPFWTNPHLLIGNQELNFVTYFDPEFGQILYAEIQNTDFSQPIKFVTDAHLFDGNHYASFFEDGDEKFYQAIYFPTIPPELINPKKVVILFDHESENTLTDKAEVYEFVKDYVFENFQEDERFNMLFSSPGGTKYLSNTWLSTTDQGNSMIFSDNDPIEDYSSVIELLIDGINYIKNNGEVGEILLVSSSDDLSPLNWTTELGQVLAELNDDDIPINIVDYQAQNFTYVQTGNGTTVVPSNYYFYYNLADITDGELTSLFLGNSTLYENLEQVFLSLTPLEMEYDFDIDTPNGFTYSAYGQSNAPQTFIPGRPLIQVGKYEGTPPLTFDVTLTIGDNTINETQTVNTLHIGDSLCREIWVGNYFQYMESLDLNNSLISFLVDMSIDERVLCDYTAFLALDLVNGGEPCPICLEAGGNGGGTVSVIDPEDSDINADISVFPNPFSDQCQIEIELSDPDAFEYIDIIISDMLGRTISRIDASSLRSQGHLTYTWDGKDEIGNQMPSGVYLFTIQTDKGIETIKLNLVR